MSQELIYRAPAKVNLGLRCSSRRPDGYHNLTTVFMAVELIDTLTCTPLPGRIEVNISGEGAGLIPTDGTDLTGRAAALLRDRFGDPGLGARLVVDKAIPVAGGMAGGSADAAAALRACNDLWSLGVSDDELTGLAIELGADVPFALLGGVALGVGRGDVLTPIPVRGSYHWVFALAHQGLSTPEVFAKYDEITIEPHEARSMDDLIEVLASGDASLIGPHLANELTPAAVALRPEIGETLAFGAALPGVAGAVLDGSGPTCAFLCQTPKAADEAAARLPELPQVMSTRVAGGPALGVTRL
ncbi:MAG: 4-(cytidine 5'-diphospho)-2-C-methyl-D-erythritol kinase [Propionibacteriaceae bacterium]|nr:4-(cytidine 5'-diphospho)-2-C-methyl-D-erythritol kinase [Propionibacteriaceae bacterium]